MECLLGAVVLFREVRDREGSSQNLAQSLPRSTEGRFQLLQRCSFPGVLVLEECLPGILTLIEQEV